MAEQRKMRRTRVIADPQAPKKAPFSAKDAEKIATNGYRVGHEDAVNQTVNMAETNPTVFVELIRGDSAPYRSAMRHKRRKVTD